MRPRLLLTINCKFAVDFFARGLHTRTAVACLPLRQLGFLVPVLIARLLLTCYTTSVQCDPADYIQPGRPSVVTNKSHQHESTMSTGTDEVSSHQSPCWCVPSHRGWWQTAEAAQRYNEDTVIKALTKWSHQLLYMAVKQMASYQLSWSAVLFKDNKDIVVNMRNSLCTLLICLVYLCK